MTRPSFAGQSSAAGGVAHAALARVAHEYRSRQHQVDHARVGRAHLHDGLCRHLPASGPRSTFGESLDGPLAEIVVSNWGTLITLVGAMLVYRALKPAVRPLALAVAGASKLVFITLVLSHGSRYLGQQAGIAIAVDLVWVVLFAIYLLGARAAPA